MNELFNINTISDSIKIGNKLNPYFLDIRCRHYILLGGMSLMPLKSLHLVEGLLALIPKSTENYR